MDRYDASDRVTVEELISSAESDVEVELARDGTVVARVVAAEPAAIYRQTKPQWLADLEAFHASLPPDFPRTGWLETLREARDEEPF